MSGETELSGLLNVALTGLKRLYDNKKFSYNKTFEETEKLYMLNSDTVSVFMEEHTQYSTEDMDGTMLYLHYAEFCQANKQERLNNLAFSKKISKLGYTNHRDNVYNNKTGRIDGSKKVTMWGNIQLKWEQIGQVIGHDENDTTCPIQTIHPIQEKQIFDVIGQGTYPIVGMFENNINSLSNNTDTAPSHNNGKNEKLANMEEKTCPSVCFSDSGGHWTGSDDNMSVNLSKRTKNTLLTSNEGNDSRSNFTDGELLRKDLKNYARSGYNCIIENVLVFVGEFNQKYPGHKNNLGLQAVLSNAERLKERGWR